MTVARRRNRLTGGASRCRRRAGGRDRGGATICLLAVGLIFVLSGIFGAGVGSARVARQQARVAADFGALAGAGRALHDESQTCARAAELVAANGARLVRCQVDGIDVVVTAEVAVRPVPGISRVATATSRAGPMRG
ncbi:Rv3654c family TadE-like protein [Micromonospora craniellae]|uniref:Helicase n=1 Tax=Micromonospora craniellae TaxID=2294034 RepID=A0A372FW63_9ACTN|nr:Rv3654c family TadE-like protein [Micromonospora craniellae]QOC94058.1 flp pilus-assembly TadE/G-like family protein [Micromonospora craniellae]RFS44760.1 helicase [Micromonospora craniellae]